MKKKYLISFIFIFFAIMLCCSKVYAADLDRIINYEVKVDPRMNDGSLDITYNIKWRVLDSTTEGPLTWVQIGTPNDRFDSATALSNTIKSIKQYNGSYVRIDFTRAYHAGEEVTFKYKIHQPYMYKLAWFGKVKYKFTPAWFSDAKVDNITILWNADSVKKSNSKSKEDNYLVWYKAKLNKGEKMTINVKYDKEAFGALDTYKQEKNARNSYGSGSSINFSGVLFILIFVISIALSLFGGGDGYYGHRGFYGGGYYGGFGGGCAHSSCACASSCASSCACACAGSGRAGCSVKDFYGTNISSKKLKEVFKKLT